MRPPLQPDRAEIARFVDVLFPYADVGTFVSLRAFFEGGKQKPAEIKNLEVNGRLHRLASLAGGMALRAANSSEPVVFCPPIATFDKPARAREVDLANGLVLSVECDSRPSAARALLEDLLGPITVVTASGGEWTDPETGEVEPKLHLHWRLRTPTREAVAHATLKRARQLATALVGGDASNVPAVHPIRWPGSWHRKSEPKLARIVALEEAAEIDLNEALARLTAAAEARSLSLARKTESNGGGAAPTEAGGDSRETGDLFAKVLSGEELHGPLCTLAMRLLRAGVPDAMAVNLLRGAMAAIPEDRRDGRWQARYDDIPRAVRSAREKLDGGYDGGTDEREVGLLEDEDAPKLTQRDKVIEIGLAAALWRDTDRNAYGTVGIGDHRENHAVRSTAFRHWLLGQYGRQYPITVGGRSVPSTPGAQALTDALGALEATACQGAEHTPAVRVGEHGGNLYLDLGRSDWSAVEVDGDGWRVAPEVPVKFIRPAGLRALPLPEEGGSVGGLRVFLNVGDGAEGEARFKLVVAFLLAALRRRGPFPILVLTGEQGSSKSTLARIVRRLIDPNAAETHSAPKDERDLVLAARNGWLVCLDNLSSVSGDLADALCRVATGSGFGTRRLWTDTEETLVEVCRPQVLNGIPDLATRPDLADRALVLMLPPLDESQRKPEAEFWAEFDAAAPRILGALLDAVSCALRRQAEVRLPRLPRMADFALWAEAAAPALGWGEGEFLAAYDDSRQAAVEATVEADCVAVAIRALVEGGRTFDGTATELLRQVNLNVRDERRKDWPKGPAQLSARLRRAAPALRRLGLVIELGRDNRGSVIRLETRADSPSAASPAPRPEEFRGLAGDGGTVEDRHAASPAGSTGGEGIGIGDGGPAAGVTANPLKAEAGDAGGGGDAVPSLSFREARL